LGRYYSRQDGCLYIYGTGGGEGIDIGLLPPDLNLFESEASWRVSPHIAVCDYVAEDALDKAEVILQEQGYVKRDDTREALEEYFRIGDESIFERANQDSMASGMVHEEQRGKTGSRKEMGLAQRRK